MAIHQWGCNMNIDLELTLLKEEEIWGSGQLEVLKKYGEKAAITDLAILTGAFVEDKEYNIEEDKTLAGRVGWQWTSSDDKDGNVLAILKDGYWFGKSRYLRSLVVRPALQSSTIFSQISPNGVAEEVEYGEYPQMAADKHMQSVLEAALQIEKLKVTGKHYTFDSIKYNKYGTGFQPVSYDEYEYEGKKYIRVMANTFYKGNPIQLSNGEYYKSGDFVWIEVQPVRWLVDSKSKTLIAKKGILSGIRYLSKNKKYTGVFKETEMYSYLNTYLIEEMIFSTVKQEKIESEEDEISKLVTKIKELIKPLDEKRKLKYLIRSTNYWKNMIKIFKI